ncbi:Gfo/Idh/MocA family oxidoreductase [Micromonospora sp. BRA006-A]|nr:Gfo/Idh/MocA family oxidoreductase [Micromonospora sp. BRA006-A]
MSPPARERVRHALVGAGARAEMFVRALALDHADTAELVALADVNNTRMDAHNRWLAELGHPPVPTYAAADVTAMLAKERVDVVLVTSVDATHDEYVTAALRAGCDVVVEKPMTVDADRCRRILDAVAETGRRVTVAFNYRYNPLHEQFRRLSPTARSARSGRCTSEWLLDVRHGADYFRRWHRDKSVSGGLLVHKSGHHFDLVNWWLDACPVEVHAYGRLFFYGADGRRHGYARDYDRAHGSPPPTATPRCAWPTTQAARAVPRRRGRGRLPPRPQRLRPGVTIEDDLAVLARYDTGATMTYHLTAYAPGGLPGDGQRQPGPPRTGGDQSDHVSPSVAGALKGAALHGDEAAVEQGAARLTLRPFWAPPQEIPVEGWTRRGHGGADAQMTRVLLGGEPDPLGRAATARDGALALLTGLAASRSLETGAPVRVADLLTLP